MHSDIQAYVHRYESLHRDLARASEDPVVRARRLDRVAQELVDAGRALSDALSVDEQTDEAFPALSLMRLMRN